MNRQISAIEGARDSEATGALSSGLARRNDTRSYICLKLRRRTYLPTNRHDEQPPAQQMCSPCVYRNTGGTKEISAFVG